MDSGLAAYAAPRNDDGEMDAARAGHGSASDVAE